MKKIILLTLLSMIYIVLPSCSSDKDEPDNPLQERTELLLIGEWSRNEKGTSYYRMVFLENGKGYDKVLSGGGYDIDETFTYKVNGLTLTINWEDSDKETFTIVDVTAKELILHHYYQNEDYYTYFTRI